MSKPRKTYAPMKAGRETTQAPKTWPPTCARCGTVMRQLFTTVECPRGCEPAPVGPPCPKCASTVTEPMLTMWGMMQRCLPCGAVWPPADP